MKLRKIRNPAADLLYPPRCPVCHEIAPGGEDICPSCVKKLPFIRGKRCEKCGKPAEAGETLCSDCAGGSHVFARGMGVFLYDDVMRGTISCLKYKGRREYGYVLGLLMGLAAAPFAEASRGGALVPVPLHRKRRLQRGYNQAEELALGAGAALGLPVLGDALIRSAETKAMKELTPAERRRNLQGAFAAGPADPSCMRLILVDAKRRFLIQINYMHPSEKVPISAAFRGPPPKVGGLEK